jgi:putative ABC transport system permease protein
MMKVLRDLRFALRQSLRRPGFTFIVVCTLALGIGASTAIFSTVNPILFEPLPYPNAKQIVMISDQGPGGPADVTFGTYLELSSRSHAFNATAVLKPWQPTITGQERPERLQGERVSADFFKVLGVSPQMGRAPTATEDRIGGALAVVISDRLWRRTLGSDPLVLGKSLTLDGQSFEVIGVMPKSFENVLAPTVDIWTTLQYDQTLPDKEGREWGHHLKMIGRLRPDISLATARQELSTLAKNPVSEYARPPWADLQSGIILDSLQDDITRGIKSALFALSAAVLLVLAMASVNVTNLLLTRGAQRTGEFAVRSALGAEPRQILRQLLSESALISLLAGGLGLLVAQVGINALVAISPSGIPRVETIHIDRTVLLFCIAITALVAVAVGIVPAWRAMRVNLQQNLQHASFRIGGGHQLMRRSLVVAEVSLALVLLISAGLLLRSLERLLAVPPGFNATRVLTMEIQVSGNRFQDAIVTHQYFNSVVEAVKRVPGVERVGLTSQLPLSGKADAYGVTFESDPSDQGFNSYRYAVTPDYFRAMQIPLRRGRLLNDSDIKTSPPVALISESLARNRFPDEDPIGKRFHAGPMRENWITVVGVVGDVKQLSLSLDQTDAFFMTPEQWTSWADHDRSLTIKSLGDPTALVPAIRDAIWSMDKDQPIVRVATMTDLVEASAAERRFLLRLFELFGIIALVLASTGIYAVISATVVERTREFGIMSALGASPSRIFALVVKQGLVLTAIGLAIGLVGAAAAGRLISSLLFGIFWIDVPTYVGVLFLLFMIGGFACALPAARASRVDPAERLRAE